MFRGTVSARGFVQLSSARSLMECRTHGEPSSNRSTMWQWPKERCSEAGSSSSALQRSWTNVATPSGSPSFSVLSYNILSDDLLRKNMNLYHTSLDPYLKWDYRKDRLLSEILSYGPDIVCLQEVEGRHFRDFFYPCLKRAGYDGLFMNRTGSYTDGCATFYQVSRFELVAERFIQYNTPGFHLLDRDNIGLLVLLRLRGPVRSQSQPEVLSSFSSNPRFMSLASCAPRVAVAIPDQEKRAGLLCVANTHLLFNPKRGDIKLAQLAVLLAEVDQMTLLPGRDRTFRCPVVMCGDFNSTPWSPIYQFLRGGQINYGDMNRCAMSGQPEGLEAKPVRFQLDCSFLPSWLGISERCTFSKVEEERQRWMGKNGKVQVPSQPTALSHSLGLASSYTHMHSDSEHEFTTWHRLSCATVDYIFFSTPVWHQCPSGVGWLERCGLRLLSRRTLLRRDALRPGMPNADYSSDHQAIQAMFEFRTGPPPS